MEIRFYGGAARAAGTSSLQFPVDEDRTLGSLLNELVGQRPDLDRVFAASSFLFDGVCVTDHDRAVGQVEQLDVLPPFAGG